MQGGEQGFGLRGQRVGRCRAGRKTAALPHALVFVVDAETIDAEQFDRRRAGGFKGGQHGGFVGRGKGGQLRPLGAFKPAHLADPGNKADPARHDPEEHEVELQVLRGLGQIAQVTRRKDGVGWQVPGNTPQREALNGW